MHVRAYRSLGLEVMPARGPLTVTVPGAVSGWFALHQRWGRLDMARLARPAISYARQGFHVTPFVSGAIRDFVDVLAKHGNGSHVFAPDGRLPARRARRPA
jgi:gamma-glutamyltranspeptidase/glutathione hydrolase